jgi:hypothetical protein
VIPPVASIFGYPGEQIGAAAAECHRNKITAVRGLSCLNRLLQTNLLEAEVAVPVGVRPIKIAIASL